VSQGPSPTAWRVRDGILNVVQPECDQLFHVFTGVKGGLIGSPMPFLNATRLLERNVAFFTDPHAACYMRGASTEVDSFAKLLNWQIAFRRDLAHARRMFCLGTSMGGYAAILFGYLLKAERVWAFSPITNARTPDGVPIDCPFPRLGDVLTTPNGVTEYTIYYNADNEKDCRAVDAIRGCDGVRLIPRQGGGHDVIAGLLAEGVLQRALVPLPDEEEALVAECV
jgi:hypothetical protein